MAAGRVLYDNFIVFKLHVSLRNQKRRWTQKGIPNQTDLALHRVFNRGEIGSLL